MTKINKKKATITIFVIISILYAIGTYMRQGIPESAQIKYGSQGGAVIIFNGDAPRDVTPKSNAYNMMEGK